jgi:glycosyltransferase involved in cell wall biosynthesis
VVLTDPFSRLSIKKVGMFRKSVCMATYNGEKFIAEQIQSILIQLDEEDEVIISDDSSTDDTVYLIKSFNDPRIKLFENQKFSSACMNFEFALKQASNDYIFLSDQDDIWVDGKVKTMMEALMDFDVVVTDHSVIDESGHLIRESFFRHIPSGRGIIKNVIKNTYFGCCMAFRQKVLKKALPFPTDIEFHDYWIGLVAGLFFKSKFIDFPFTLYRSHENNVTSGTLLQSPNPWHLKLKYRINVVKYIPLLLLR